MDNTDKGGLVVLVNEDGQLFDYALDHRGKKFYKHPDGYVFTGKSCLMSIRLLRQLKNYILKFLSNAV